MLHIAMEYLSGGDLASLIERRGEAHEPFSEQEVLAIFVQLALAVHYVHAQAGTCGSGVRSEGSHGSGVRGVSKLVRDHPGCVSPHFQTRQ